MQSDWVGDKKETPRTSKRRCDFNSVPIFSAPTFLAKSNSITILSLGLESHYNRHLSLIKQLQVLKDFNEQPIVFYNFDDDVGERR